MILIFLFLLLLSNPALTFLGAKTGLNLWLYSIVPSLLPFLILSNLLFEADAISYLTALLAPFFRFLFGISEDASFAVISGFLCGFPMGSKSCMELVKREKIGKDEAARLAGFCNNASPAFVISFILNSIFPEEKQLFFPVLFSFYAAPLLTGVLFCLPIRKKKTSQFNEKGKIGSGGLKIKFQYLDNAIMNAFQTILRLGGYLTFFSVLSAFVQSAFFLPEPLRLFLTALMELTCGASVLGKMNAPLAVRVLSVCACVSLGGLSGFAQSCSFLKEESISVRYYILGKLTSSFLCILFLYFFLSIL